MHLHPTFGNYKLRVIAEDASYFAGRSRNEAKRSRGGRSMWVAKYAADVAMTGPPRPWSGKKLPHETTNVTSLKYFARQR